MLARHHQTTLDDYFSAERLSPRRHEYVDGQIYLMAGGSTRHNYLALQVLGPLREQLAGGPCIALSGDQRIGIPDGTYTYADGSVFCGEIHLGREHTGLNPTVLVEVCSESTRAYDRGEKLERYKLVPSLRHVVLVEQDAVDVEVWTRREGGWTREVVVDPRATVRLEHLGIELSVAEIYQGADRVPA
jgi:Uma2 family endonuclease